ncbi:aldo/keto reductase [Streptomyces sp. NPDC002409]
MAGPSHDAPHERRASSHLEFRRPGRSGLTISGIAHGNWLTHGSPVEEDTAAACTRAALAAGTTTFDTSDVHAGPRAEAVPGRAPKGELHEGIEVFTEVCFPTGPGHNDRGLARKHIMESIDNSPRRLRTDYVDLYQAHRHDHSTPLEETMEAFADVVRSGKALHIGVSERTPRAART